MMNKIILVTVAAAGLVAGAEPNIDAGYEKAMRQDEANISAADWSKKNEARLAAATADSVLAACVADDSAAKDLLDRVADAYETDPLVACQIAAVTQWVMLPDPWYCLLWDGEHAAGRKVWTSALVRAIAAARCPYVRKFYCEQLRWCGYPDQMPAVEELFTEHGAGLVPLPGVSDRSDRRLSDPVIGNWSANLPQDVIPAASLIFSRDENGVARAFVLWSWGSPEWCKDVKVEGDGFSLRHPYGQLMRGRVEGDRLHAEIAPCDRASGERKGDWRKFEGWRNRPSLPGISTRDAAFGEPIDLLKDGLDGWKAMNGSARFCWSFADGVLSNNVGYKPDGSWAGGGANLVTRRADFGDFNLEFDVRVKKGSNSGVYLRGRFECQIIDSHGNPPNRHSMASYYGRVTPQVAAEKAPGEWQHVSVTIYRRRMTIVLNGTVVIEDAELTGVTGCAIDADIDAPGPIYLQGDHSDADYRNMILRPVIN